MTLAGLGPAHRHPDITADLLLPDFPGGIMLRFGAWANYTSTSFTFPCIAVAAAFLPAPCRDFGPATDMLTREHAAHGWYTDIDMPAHGLSAWREYTWRRWMSIPWSI